MAVIPKIVAGDDFAGLKRYLVENREHDVIEPRGVPLDSYIDQMEMIASTSSRCKKPVKHVSLAAATADGRLTDDEWLEIVDEATNELGLAGHERVIVRHRDKPYDHIHVFWCVVNAETGRRRGYSFAPSTRRFQSLAQEPYR